MKYGSFSYSACNNLRSFSFPLSYTYSDLTSRRRIQCLFCKSYRQKSAIVLSCPECILLRNEFYKLAVFNRNRKSL